MAAPQEAAGPKADLPRVSGNHRLLRELGRGGMGVVYEAEESSSGRRVALKVLSPDLRTSPEALKRFHLEARLAAAISHPRCVFVYGAHELEGSPAISMELMTGRTLEDRLQEKEPIPIRTAVRWTLEILDGLDAAHRAGVLHRDIKPSNCFLTSDDQVKIGDFGISRLLESEARLTLSGQFLGTPVFASPEQVRGEKIDFRSDLYSVGATLYTLLTGVRPFQGSGIGQLMAQVLEKDPRPPRAIRPEVPRDLERIVLRAMEKDASRRFQDLAGFRIALEPFASATTSPARPVARFGAYLIDCMIGWLAWLPIFVLILRRDPSEKASLPSALLGTAFSFLYFTIGEGIFGTTPGKWAMGQRVVAVGTGQPSLVRAALRALVFLVPDLLSASSSHLLDLAGAAIAPYLRLGPYLLEGAANLALFSTMRVRNGYRAVHELASGTRVVRGPSPFALRRRPESPPSRVPVPADDLPTVLGPYGIEGVIGRTPSGRMLQARDPILGRAVWIHYVSSSTRAFYETRRSLGRPGRLRWLDSVRDSRGDHEVFEAPEARAWRTVWPRTGLSDGRSLAGG